VQLAVLGFVGLCAAVNAFGGEGLAQHSEAHITLAGSLLSLLLRYESTQRARGTGVGLLSRQLHWHYCLSWHGFNFLN
jgi:hypothetical protein